MDRLDTLAAHPELQERRRKAEEKDAARIDRLVGMLPDAEVYTLEGMRVACGAGQCYRLSFAPNPTFEPPDMEAEVLQGFAGEVWIDKAQEPAGAAGCAPGAGGEYRVWDSGAAG